MSVISCNDGAQSTGWCPTSVPDMLPSVIGLLPQGDAWDQAQVPGTVLNRYWSSIAAIALYVNQRICAYYEELFCDRAVESLDQWAVEWALGEACDPYGYNLCAKVTALGAATCAEFVQLASDNGWVITCSDLPAPTVGCFQIGCDQIGAAPALVQSAADPADSTGNWRFGYGNTFVWAVNIDMPASIALQARMSDEARLRAGAQGLAFAAPSTNLGNFQVGCSPICAGDQNFALCFLQTIQPAHTTLITTLTQS